MMEPPSELSLSPSFTDIIGLAVADEHDGIILIIHGRGGVESREWGQEGGDKSIALTNYRTN
jgi:hypothetical protein